MRGEQPGVHSTARPTSRGDGCQTERWNKLEKVLGPVSPGGPMIPAASGSLAAG